MYEHLNTRTRQIVSALARGDSVELGGGSIEGFTGDEATVLKVLARHLLELKELRRGSLVERVIELFNDEAEEGGEAAEGQIAGDGEDAEATEELANWKLGHLRAWSFRGLAPARREWRYDFSGKSHLLYGPNGCGKSSLLGAICWCLTGRIFRDDQAPDVPEKVKVYSVSGTTTVSERPDGLALMDETGANTAGNDEYWVALQLLGSDEMGEQREVWIRRHNQDGLERSDDGENWTSIRSTSETGVDELDAELHLLMPARVGHIRFGKDAELLRVFSQIVGLDDLEAIAELAASVSSGLRRKATGIERGELASEERKISEYIKELADCKDEIVTALASFNEVVGDRRTVADVEAFERAITEKLESLRGQLASDLGIEIPSEDSDGYSEFKEKLENLPGQVHDVIEELEKSLEEVFSKSVGFSGHTEEELDLLEQGLGEFERTARQRVKERLEWAREEQEDEKASLMLHAAGHFPEGASDCPVCEQDLKEVPGVREKLESLRPLAREDHLRAKVDDLELQLVEKLGNIVTANLRDEGKTGLCERVLSDWDALKERVSKGLLGLIVEKFDTAIAEISKQMEDEEELERTPLADGFLDEFPGVFVAVDSAIDDAKKYIRLCRTVADKKAELKGAFGKALTGEEREGEEDSLRVILERGRATNREIKSLGTAYETTRELWRSVKNREQLSGVIQGYRKWAGSGDKTKELGENVRAEVAAMVGDLEEKMKENFACLYENEILELDMLTTGHPGNPHLKNQINAYLRAGSKRVPIGPFSNSGRLRALILAFVFALFEESNGSFGFIILDDPAMSLDDEHKTRFVDDMVGPRVAAGQVLLATHYERFYKDAEPVFNDGECLVMPYRRRVGDGVSFEPGNLLERVERSLEETGGSWREAAGNLRIWAERVLSTLSSYCPEPFAVFNNVPQSIANYANITDRNVATPERDQIVAALNNPRFQRVLHTPAHDESLNDVNVRDALRALEPCRRAVKKEISRFRELRRHEVQGRGVTQERQENQASIQILSFEHTIAGAGLEIVRAAAAAHNGEGIEWDENEMHTLEGHPVVILTTDVISPIGLLGQYLVLDNQERMPANKDLVAVKTENGERYVRRFWQEEDGSVVLEAANPTKPWLPVRLRDGQHSFRRVVGVLFANLDVTIGAEGREWVPGELADGWLNDVAGVRIRGTSMEPVARDGQTVLVKKTGEIKKADLGCVDIEQTETVIKRCYPGNEEWVLCSVNPSEVEDPMRVDTGTIRYAYPVCGVMFEL